MTLFINGQPVEVAGGTTVAAALMQAGVARNFVDGEPRAVLCGMGVCFECAARVDGMWTLRTCLVRCTEGMEVETR
ncbi:MAG: proline dehydrogenase [Chthonomonas sp.]